MSVALATSISAWVNAYLLASKLPQKIDSSARKLSLSLCLVSGGAGALTVLYQTVFLEELGVSFLEKAWQLAAMGLLYLGAFLGLCFWFRIEEVTLLFKRRVPS